MTGSITLSALILSMAVEAVSISPSVPFSCKFSHRGPCTFNESGHYHSSNDAPAAADFHGKYWYKNGVLHRIGGPAAEMHNGDKYWYENGKLIRYEVTQ